MSGGKTKIYIMQDAGCWIGLWDDGIPTFYQFREQLMIMANDHSTFANKIFH